MHRATQKTTSLSVFWITGILVLGMALFANRLGLDPNAGWGKGRIALTIFGLLIVSLPWLVRRQVPAFEKIRSSDLFAFPALLIVIGAYCWFVSISHQSTSNYYWLLASSFRNGELSLPLKPDPALLQLKNPYDPAERQGIKVPVDLSLYQGKFYLYWGPAPSALLAIVQPLLPGKIEEVHLLFLFMCGIFLIQYLLIMNLWERFFNEIPRWMLILSIFLAGLANPALWLLSQPKIYEAAIAGAQFFFIAGLLAAILAVESQPPSKWTLAVAGIFWSLAVGTRSVMVFSVIFMTLMVIYWYFRMYRRSFAIFVSGLLPLGLTLFAGAVGFCWYNWARFGSFLETGFTYQLAAPYLQKHLNDLFLPGYILQNLYNYLINPFTIKPSFPFLFPIRGIIQAIFPGQALPELYTAQAITGFLCTTPFIVFGILPIVSLWKQALAKNKTRDVSRDSEAASLRWITTSLLGSFLFPFLSLLAFFWAAMRYTEDFMPELILLSIIGFWQGYRLLSRPSGQGKIYATLGLLLAGLSIVTGLCLALSILVTNGWI